MDETFFHFTEVVAVPQGDDVTFVDHLIRVRADQILEYSAVMHGDDPTPARTHIITPYRAIFVRDPPELIDAMIMGTTWTLSE